MIDKYIKVPHTGKTIRNNKIEITLDSNMVGYLHKLSKVGNLSAEEYIMLKKELNQATNEEMNIMLKIVNGDFKDIQFHTTPQVIDEIIKCAEVRKDPSIINFLAKICKIHIPKDREDKIKCAELIVDLMEEYLRKDISLNNDVRELESAISGGKKKGEDDYSDAKIVAENTILNGCPVVTRNGKHLIFIERYNRRNKLRSQAILSKNATFLRNHSYRISSKKIREHLNSAKSTTFRVNDVPYIVDDIWHM